MQISHAIHTRMNVETITSSDIQSFDAISLSLFGVLSHFFSTFVIYLLSILEYLRDNDSIERSKDRSLWDKFVTKSYFKMIHLQSRAETRRRMRSAQRLLWVLHVDEIRAAFHEMRRISDVSYRSLTARGHSKFDEE